MRTQPLNPAIQHEFTMPPRYLIQQSGILPPSCSIAYPPFGFHHTMSTDSASHPHLVTYPSGSQHSMPLDSGTSHPSHMPPVHWSHPVYQPHGFPHPHMSPPPGTPYPNESPIYPMFTYSNGPPLASSIMYTPAQAPVNHLPPYNHNGFPNPP